MVAIERLSVQVGLGSDFFFFFFFFCRIVVIWVVMMQIIIIAQVMETTSSGLDRGSDTASRPFPDGEAAYGQHLRWRL